MASKKKADPVDQPTDTVATDAPAAPRRRMQFHALAAAIQPTPDEPKETTDGDGTEA